MPLTDIALKLGLTEDFYKQFLDGKAQPMVAGELGVKLFDLQDFLDGGAPAPLASKLGVSTSTLRTFRNSLGSPQAAAGFITGFLYK